MSEHIKCMVCGKEIHSVSIHLKEEHWPEWTIERYRNEFPDTPVLSERAKEVIRRRKEEMEKSTPAARVGAGTNYLHDVFNLGAVPGAMNARGEPIPITVLDVNEELVPPDVDPGYIFELESLKNCMMALELNMPLYVWGHAGTGKTTLIEQICARTNRSMLRIQHTTNTEEAHIVGQWVARGGETHFEHGPLAMAMKNGWVYLADEYDFAQPSVLAVYQPVLEGKPLVIKEADAANRIIRPHPNFRFVATGNTNGSGDETGLYQGTLVQNAANYDRFNMVIEHKYMAPVIEQKILMNQAGLSAADAEKLVGFANRVRESYSASKISAPISPRALIAIGKIGRMRSNYVTGIQLAYSNKLSRIDQEVVSGLAQRVFG